MKIQVREQHLSSVEALREARKAREEVREISDAAAVTFASWWQGPGRPGSALAAFASGTECDTEVLREDLSLTIQLHYRESGEADKLSLDMLGTYLISKSYGTENWRENHPLMKP